MNPKDSRSGLDRCLRRHGVGNLRDLKAKEARPKHSDFKAYEPGHIHIDVNGPQADECRAIAFGNLRTKKVNIRRTFWLSHCVCNQVLMIFDPDATLQTQ